MTLPVSPISATDIMKRAAIPEPDIQALTQRFDQLMSRDHGNNVGNNVPTTILPPQISNAIHSLDAANRMLDEDLRRAIIDAPHMDLRATTALNMEITLRSAMAQSQMTMCSSVAKSGKDGLTTLIKNQ